VSGVKRASSLRSFHNTQRYRAAVVQCHKEARDRRHMAWSRRTSVICEMLLRFPNEAELDIRCLTIIWIDTQTHAEIAGGDAEPPIEEVSLPCSRRIRQRARPRAHRLTRPATLPLRRDWCAPRTGERHARWRPVRAPPAVPPPSTHGIAQGDLRASRRGAAGGRIGRAGVMGLTLESRARSSAR
jgi:hypothetical protein